MDSVYFCPYPDDFLDFFGYEPYYQYEDWWVDEEDEDEPAEVLHEID